MTQKVRQFKGTAAPRTFYDRKIRRVGFTRTISMGKVLPKNWRYVRLEVVERTEDSITLKLTRLLGNKDWKVGA